MKRTTIMVEQHKFAPPENPLLSIIGLDASEKLMDLSDGGDEALLSVAYHRQWQNTLERDAFFDQVFGETAQAN